MRTVLTASEEIKERTYDLKCRGQKRMIQVSIPVTVPLKEFDYNAEMELINSVVDTVANASFHGADDIVLKSRPAQPTINPQNHNNHQNQEKNKFLYCFYCH